MKKIIDFTIIDKQSFQRAALLPYVTVAVSVRLRPEGVTVAVATGAERLMRLATSV